MGPAAPDPNSRILVPAHAFSPFFADLPALFAGRSAKNEEGSGPGRMMANRAGRPSSAKNSRAASWADAYSSFG